MGLSPGMPTVPWMLTAAVAADEENSCSCGHQGQGAGMGLGLLGAAGPEGTGGFV